MAESHFWKLTWHRKLRLWHRDECLQENLVVDFCQFGEKREYQNWKYELDTKQVISLWKDKWCLTATANLTLYLNPCNSTDSAQKWKFDYFNETALRNFDNIFWKNNEVFGLDLT